MVGKKWTGEELENLKKTFSKLTKQQLEEVFKRSWPSIKSKAFSLKLKRGDGYFWTEDEETLLKDKYSMTTTKELAILFPHKSENTLRNKAKSLDLVKNPTSYNRSLPWTGTEISLLEDKYPSSTPKDLKELFPNRELRSIKIKASRLGIKKNKSIGNLLREETNLKKYGVKYISQSSDVRETIKRNSLEKWGKDHHTKSEKYQKQKERQNLEKWGVRTNLQLESTKEKIKKTNLKRYGVANPMQFKDVQEKVKQTNLKRYGHEYGLQSKEVIKKREDTLKERYGVVHNMHLESTKDKIKETKKKNGTFNTSRPEEDLYIFLKDMFSGFTVIRQYSEDLRYPFACDFYIKELDYFIEFQGSWTHGKEPFNGSNLDLKWIEKSEKSDYYKNAVRVYTEKDPNKRKAASESDLNYLEIWYEDILLGAEWLSLLFLKQGLPLKYSEKILQREFQRISEQPGNFSRNPNQNKIVEHFQPHFYRKERELWNNPKIREKLVANRVKYKFKDSFDITIKQYLQGFKISGIHIGYSFFSPLWIKAFIEKYDIKSIYDPCMGWGHRLLGASNITYIGNDLCKETYEGNINLADYFGIKNKVFYNKLAEELIPKENYEAVFTCPPYFSIEKYRDSDTSTSRYPAYEEWLNLWWRAVVLKCLVKKPKYFAFVINNRYKEDMKNICISEGLSLLEEIPVGKNSKNHFQRVSPKSYKGESLLVFKTINH